MRRRKLFVASIALVAIITLVALLGPSSAEANSSLIKVYADGTEMSVNTRVGTVGDALAKLGVAVNEHDLVEPSVNTPVNEAIFKINVYRARPVTVVDGDTVRQVMSPYRSNRLIAADAGIVVYDEDKFIMERVDDILLSGLVGQKLTIIRAAPITIDLYGTELDYRTHAKTVGEALNEIGINLSPDDRVRPSLNSPVTADQEVEVIHTGTKVEAREEKIAYSTDIIYDNDLASGVRKVETEGKPGTRLVTYELVLENGKVVKKNQLQSVVSKKPVTEVVRVGNKSSGFSPNENVSAWLLALRMCESTNNYQAISSTTPTYYGAYQFLISTWDSIASRVRPDLVGVRPDQAAPSDQDFMIVQNTNMSNGGLASQNPGCYSSLGLSQFPPGS